MFSLYVDDIRVRPDCYDRIARTVEDAKLLLSTGDVGALSLDHDMGACPECVRQNLHIGDMATDATTFLNWCPHVEDGTSLVRWMVETGTWPADFPLVHSANPAGRARMLGLIHQFYGQPAMGPMFYPHV